tara:strand:+ start:459 stop:1130 length:672 start_codon:yes stop_codon:yes gene_type:complete
MSKDNWQKIYQQGLQLNLYPYDFIVSHFFQFRSHFKNKPITVLDLGCGGGNHSVFCAENGAEVIAVDYSTAALKVVEQRAKEKGFNDLISTYQVDFEDFKLPLDIKIDLVIDRLSTTHTSGFHVRTIYNRLFDQLNDGAIILSCLFSMGHTHKDFGRYDSQQDIWLDFKDGVFEDLLSANFYNEAQIRDVFSRYRLNSLKRETDQELIDNNGCMEIWKIIAQK